MKISEESIKILEILNKRYPVSCREEELFSTIPKDRKSLHFLREKKLVSASFISEEYSDIVISAKGIEHFDHVRKSFPRKAFEAIMSPERFAGFAYSRNLFAGCPVACHGDECMPCQEGY